MRKLTAALAILACMVFVLSCQKEFSEENGTATASLGTLKSSVTGDCLPSTTNGIFKVATALSASNYVDVQVDVATPGAYQIKSDTLNGYSFQGQGIFSATGLTTVRLQGTGTPGVAETNSFTITYGASICVIDVTVISASTGAAAFTLGGSPSACTGAVVNGTLKAGTATSPANSITLNINVTATGTYNLTSTSVDGVTFGASGVFVNIGAQTVTLAASGTPTAAGTFNTTVSTGTASCTVSFTVTAGGTTPTAAVYTLGGAGADCTGATLGGTYMAGTAMTASNTATINVNVTTIGTYTISSTAVNGVTFSKTGSFTTTGPQTVVLVATGTPTAAGAKIYPITGNASSCNLTVTYVASGPQAVYTLAGAPGACSAAVISGTYTVGTALTASNTITVNVNVTTLGTYTLTTNTVSGMTFSGSGTFTTLGGNSVILTGTGNPTVSGSAVLTPQIAGSSCTVTIPVAGSAATDFLQAKINGVLTTFNVNLAAVIDNSAGFPILDISGDKDATNPDYLEIGVGKTAGTITAGTYTVNQSASGIIVGAFYGDSTPTDYEVQSDPTTTGNFTITITSITATRVSGTFSGVVKDNSGAGPGFKTITEGTFSVPF